MGTLCRQVQVFLSILGLGGHCAMNEEIAADQLAVVSGGIVESTKKTRKEREQARRDAEKVDVDVQEQYVGLVPCGWRGLVVPNPKWKQEEEQRQKEIEA